MRSAVLVPQPGQQRPGSPGACRNSDGVRSCVSKARYGRPLLQQPAAPPPPPESPHPCCSPPRPESRPRRGSSDRAPPRSRHRTAPTTRAAAPFQLSAAPSLRVGWTKPATTVRALFRAWKSGEATKARKFGPAPPELSRRDGYLGPRPGACALDAEKTREPLAPLDWAPRPPGCQRPPAPEPPAAGTTLPPAGQRSGGTRPPPNGALRRSPFATAALPPSRLCGEAEPGSPALKLPGRRGCSGSALHPNTLFSQVTWQAATTFRARPTRGCASSEQAPSPAVFPALSAPASASASTALW